MNGEHQYIAGRGVLVFTPDRPIRVGRKRLEALREDATGSSIDRSIVDAVGEHAGGIDAIVFRGVNEDGLSTWAFDEDLRDDEADELGRLLVRSQIPMYRHLATEGVLVSVKVGWGPRETNAFQAGTQTAVAELQEAIRTNPLHSDAHALRELDLWLMQYFSTWLLAPFERCRDTLLPRMLSRLAPRRSTLERLLSAVPPVHLGDALSLP